MAETFNYFTRFLSTHHKIIGTCISHFLKWSSFHLYLYLGKPVKCIAILCVTCTICLEKNNVIFIPSVNYFLGLLAGDFYCIHFIEQIVKNNGLQNTQWNVWLAAGIITRSHNIRKLAIGIAEVTGNLRAFDHFIGFNSEQKSGFRSSSLRP